MAVKFSQFSSASPTASTFLVGYDGAVNIKVPYTSLVGGSGTTNYLSKWTSSSALGNSLVYDDGTNVGIGTITPSSTMELRKATGTNYLYLSNGASGTNNGVVLRYNSVDYMGMIGNFTTGEFKVGGFNAGGYFMSFYSNNSERMRLTPSGRLLIGTTTESTYELDVVGDIRSTLDANINGLTVGKGGGSVAENTAFGVNALVSNTTGSAVTAVGYLAGNANGTSNHNTYIGTRTGISATGANNTFVGSLAGFSNTTGNLNTFLGNFAGYEVTTGTNNTFVGYYVGSGITTGTYNTMIGKSTVGNGITTGSFNTIIGSQITGLSSSLSNTIILADGQGNQRFYINNTGTSYIKSASGYNSSINLHNPSGSGYNLVISSEYSYDPFVVMSWGGGLDPLSPTRNNFLEVGSVDFSLKSPSVFKVFTAASERMRVFSNGNVGIGTTTDAGYRLDVSGTTRISGTELRLDNGTTGVINLYSATPEVRFSVGDPTNYRLYRTSTNMVLNSAGAVALQIGGNNGYTLDATNGHTFRTALSGGAALARLTTGGNFMVGTTTDVASAILQLSSTTKGFLPPVMTGAQAEAIATPATGLMVYANNGNGTTITSTGWWGYNGTTWVKLN